MTETASHCDPNRRHDFILLFDVTDGNPNGDPDAGNLPRVDPETMQGIVTDVCIKRKIRNYVTLAGEGENGTAIYVQDQGIALNTLHQEAYNDLGITSTGTKQDRKDVQSARAQMCKKYYDVRVFGAVMTTGVNCGQVRGPIQLTFSRSIDPILPLDLSITRVAITRPEDAAVVVADAGDAGEKGKETSGKTTEMGRKPFVPYGLYRGHGFFSASLAGQTGVSTDDLALFWTALQQMWDQDHSASRGMMACRGLYVFSHENRLGNAPAHTLFDRLQVKRVEGVETSRKFADYDVSLNGVELPAGVEITRLVG